MATTTTATTKQKLKPKRAEQNIMARRLARWLRRTDRETYGQTDRRTYDPTLTPLQRLSPRPLHLPLLAHTHFYMGAARTPM